MIYHTTIANDWSAIAAEILTALPKRTEATILALEGTLGAGKTTCTQALARALGVAENVVSPTFVLMQIYRAHHERFDRLVHIDAYRLEDPEEAVVLRLDEYLSDSRTLIVVEWPEYIAHILPNDIIKVSIAIEGDGRIIEVSETK